MELKKISQEELEEKLQLHKKWLNNEEDGVKLDLSYTDLRGADLRCADLYGVDLSYAHLSYANLKDTNLEKTKLYLTNLYKTKGEVVGIENIGSRNDTTHYFYNEDRIICGCFDGTMEEFENRVKEEYEKEDKEYKQYMIAIDTLKKLAELEK